MFTLKGDYGKVIFDGRVAESGLLTSRSISLDSSSAINIFKNISIVKTNIVQNALGLFTFIKGDTSNKIKFGRFSGGNHLLQSFKVGCAWNPKGGIQFDTDEFEIYPVEYNGEQCPDEFYGRCFNAIFAPGNGIRDILSTDKGRAIWNEFLDILFTDLGNSFYELVSDGQHPLITSSFNGNWYSENDRLMVDYVDQQAAAPGINTLIYNLKSTGDFDGTLGLPINDSDVSEDRLEYTGSAMDLFEMILRKKSTKMRLLEKRYGKSIIRVTPNIFRNYENELLEKYDKLPEIFRYYLKGMFASAADMAGTTPVEGVLLYKGHPVVSMDEWEDFDVINGVKTFKAEMTIPGNYVIGYDVPDLKQFAGMGMRIVQHLEAPYQGKIFMDTAFKIGTAVIDPSLIYQASKVYVPA